MRALLARYRGSPGSGDEIERTLQRMAESVRDEEPGCLLYRAARSIDDPDMFLLYEEYVDQAALEAHRETPHFRTLIEGIVVPLLEAREREVLVPVQVDGGAGSTR
jgi:quinol monooxygenase YgiN